MHKFTGKIALVTGAAGGLGREITFRLANEGATVIASDLNFTHLNEVFNSDVYQNLKIIKQELDVTDPEAFENLVQSIKGEFGRLDIAVNNAGIGGDITLLAEYSLEMWNKVFQVNVDSIFYGMRAQIPVMIEQGSGTIINIASIMGTLAMPGIAPYVASKHAVVGLTKAAAMEYGKKGIRVNAIGPSFVRTGFTAKALNDDIWWDELENKIALSGQLSAQDIAASVSFLASEDAKFITGSLQLVDGGYSLS